MGRNQWRRGLWPLAVAGALAVGLQRAEAQIPAKCLEIESILVDACIDLTACPGASEGQNEMVRFRTGPQVTALSDISVDWPNNNWRGLVQDGTTAGLTAALNTTVQGCGWLLEPAGGIIPPGSPVLMVTSTAMCTAANSFTNLGDTLYIVFQAPGNTAGHFANHNNGGSISTSPVGPSQLRQLIITYTPTGCADTVNYDRSLLTNNQGTYGGSSVLNDGATAEFSWPGEPPVANYVNYGCQAPFVPILVSVDAAVGSICAATGTVQLTGSASGAYTSLLWQGGTGTFSDPTALQTSYTAGQGDTGPVVVQLCAIGDCGAPICVDYTLPSGSAPSVTISPTGSPTLCPGQSLTLTAAGADTYTWSNQEATAAISISQPGIYTVTGTNACGTGSASVTVAAGSLPAVQLTLNGPGALCPGQTTSLVASGADSYTWSNQQTGPVITVTQPGSYSVTGTNSCGSSSAQITIGTASGPSVSITPSGQPSLCQGQSLVLTASGADTYAWSTSESGASITVNQPGSYSVQGTNACGMATASITIAASSGPSVSISASGPLTFCPGGSVTLTASGADSYVWNTQQQVASITVTQAGTYTVAGTNACGTATAQVEVAVIPVNAAFLPTPSTGLAPLTVAFANGSTPANGTMAWDFGDGFLSSDPEPTHLYTQAGTYIATLTVTTQGCTSSSSFTITVTEMPSGPSSLFVPNVFSPNGDGVNDQLTLRAENMRTLEMTIFNRWGLEVARLQRGNQAWDARTFSGEIAPDGTYFYVLEATGNDGRSYSEKGAITVLR